MVVVTVVLLTMVLVVARVVVVKAAIVVATKPVALAEGFNGIKRDKHYQHTSSLVMDTNI